MRIALFIEQAFDPSAGGVQRTTSKLAQIFSAQGHQVIIISVADQLLVTDYYGIPVYRATNKVELKDVIEIEDIEIVINQAGYSLKHTKLLLAIAPNAKIINTLRINPLNFYNNYQFTLAHLFNQKKLSFLNHPIVYKLIRFYHVLKQRYELGFIIKHTHAFVMLSERFKEELYFLVPSVKKYDHKIFGINNPFKLPKLDIASLEKKNVILYVGRIELNQKRIDLLIEIWHELHTKLIDWEFWVVGHGPQEEFMKAYCKKHQLYRVKFFGKKNPNEYYKQAKVLHLTSAFEGFGNVLVEAQLYGCVPILFDSYAAASEIINHNVDGFLIKPFNIKSYVEQTLFLSENQNQLREASLLAYQNSGRFSFDNIYQKWLNVFQKLA